MRSLSCSRYGENGRSGAHWGQSDAPKTRAILPRTGEPGSQKRIAMPRRASVHYQPANVQITAHLLHSARHSFNDTRTRERTVVNPRRASCHPLFPFRSLVPLSPSFVFLSIERISIGPRNLLRSLYSDCVFFFFFRNK